MDLYPRVERAHVVPRAYLRNFADDEQMIGMRLVGEPGTEKVVSTRDAAVRKRFYRRTRPDGTPIDDVEHSLGLIERRAAPILREIEQRWPLGFEDKRILGEFFALQVLRSPRSRRTYEMRTDRLVDEYQTSRLFADEIAESGQTPDEVFARTHELFTSDSFRLRRMLGMSSNGSSIFGSMIWALIRFPKPTLVTADHPITGWSRFETRCRPKVTPDGVGLLNQLEVRAPVSSTAAIVMTWLDQAEDIPVPFDGGRREARNINAFTIAQAEKAWFHLPGMSPSYGKNRPYPALSVELFPDYGPDAAGRSVLRRAVSDKVNAVLGEESNEYEIITLGHQT